MIAVLLMFGCGMAEKALVDFDSADAEDGLPEGALRIDVTPISSSGLLPQSTVLAPWQYQASVPLNLAPTVTFEGNLTGMVTHPWGAAPAEEEPLDAVITAAISNSVAYGITLSEADEGGFFSLSLPRQAGYTLAIVPSDAAASPVQLSMLDLGESVSEDIQLPVGIPIYGRVTDVTGTPLPGAPLKLYADDSPIPISSSTFTTDANGWYLARIAAPGTWHVATISGPVGSDGYLLPQVEVPVVVESELGARADLSIGAPVPSKLIGKVVDGTGAPISQARVRLTSLSLAASKGSFSAEVDTSRDGTFYAEALAGSYQVEIIAPYDSLISPVVQVEEIGAHVRDLGTIGLKSHASLEGLVLGGAEGVGGVMVTATQRGFGRYVYTTTTNEKGSYHLDVPAGDYDMVFTPANADSWAITHDQQTTDTSPIFALESGVQVFGTVTYDGSGLGASLIEIHSAASDVLLGRALTDEDGGFSVRVELTNFSGTSIDSGGTSDTGAGTDTGSDTGS